jgi:hypothetical protein
VEVDLHQLELRHRDLRIHDGEQRRRLIGSVAEIGQQVPVVVIRDAAGRYPFEPGKEMQHDTSPHDVDIGGAVRRVQTASLVLCHSHHLFFQFYPRFTRFECKLFLNDGAQYHDGTCEHCMVDSTHVIVLSGTGKDMVPVPEMEAFGRRLNFAFVAHEKGDANRSAQVERPFDYIERNFVAGRKFTDFADANRQAREWWQPRPDDCARALEEAVDRLHEIAEVVLAYKPQEAEFSMTKALEITLDETLNLSGADLLFARHR